MTESTSAVTGNAAHSPSTFAQSNTQAKLSSLSPDMIAEDATDRELLLEMHILMPPAIETLHTITTPSYASNFSPYYFSLLQMVAYDTPARKILE
jgi:hypothetical protein